LEASLKIMRLWKFGIILALLTGGVLPARAAGEIVVANRYLLPNRTSHAHLYLYREDGRLLRQLSRDNSGQDRNPIFAPDGETICWTRVLPGGAKQWWSITPRGANAHRLKAAPSWYRSTRTSPYFADHDSPDASRPAAGDKAPRVRTPDGAQEIVLREDPSDEGDQWDGEGHGRHYLLHDLKTGKETEFGKLPGFYGVFDLLQSNRNAKQRFLWEKNLHAAFFDLHLDSTEGDTVFALDLIGKRLVRLSPNWAAPVPLPGESAFLTLTYNRYVPIPGSRKTANCYFFERWDANFKKVRYARTNCVVSYGASFYRPGRAPRVVTIRGDDA
jgi:hypothetical protein